MASRTLAAVRTRAAAPALSLDERLTLRSLAMDDRLNTAGLAVAVRLAPIETPEPEILTAPMPAASRQPATGAEVLREARRILADPERGWCKRWLADGVRVCAWGAIREAAGGDNGLADEAAAVLLDRIRAEQPDILSVPDWNDRQASVGPVLRMFGR